MSALSHLAWEKTWESVQVPFVKKHWFLIGLTWSAFQKDWSESCFSYTYFRDMYLKSQGLACFLYLKQRIDCYYNQRIIISVSTPTFTNNFAS